MTGFGRGEAAIGTSLLTAEIRCLNSRHLDVRVRLPRELSALEAEARSKASRFFRRGQVEVSIRLTRQGELAPRIEVDFEAARSYVDSAAELRERLSVEDRIPVADLLALPGVSRLCDPELEPEEIGAGLLQAIERAAIEAAAMRSREGESLEQELRERLSRVEEIILEIEARASEAQEGSRERLAKRIAALAPDVELDEGRLEQEVLLQVDRMDVTEELVRSRSHCEQFREILEADQPAGRKLEFLLQELGRETNTIGSKAADATITRAVVELKSELEKLREQALNVE
jgi:uncharacterized protein (TIGR00255 family)